MNVFGFLRGATASRPEQPHVPATSTTNSSKYNSHGRAESSHNMNSAATIATSSSTSSSPHKEHKHRSSKTKHHHKHHHHKHHDGNSSSSKHHRKQHNHERSHSTTHNDKTTDKYAFDIINSNPKTMDLEARAQAIANYLEKVPLLARISDKDRLKLGRAFKDKIFRKGDIVIRQGDTGDEFFIIKSGEASVLIRNSETKEDDEVAILKTGDYFGETALLTAKPRNATVRSIDVLFTLVLDKDTFTSVFGKERVKVNFGKRGAISAEMLLQSPRQAIRRQSRMKTEKDEMTKELIATAVENNVLFAALDEEQVRRIVEVMWEMDVKRGLNLINQGESGDNFYVVGSGVFDIFVTRNGEEKLVAQRRKGESFGELALMYNSPRSATVRAREDCKVWAVERYMFRKILIRVSEEKLKEYENFLREVPILNSLLAMERRAVAEALDEVKFKEGETIVRQGEPGDTFYIIRKGTAVVYKSVPANAPPKEVLRLKSGGFFGERALLKNDTRAATVKVAGSGMVCLSLDREAFCLLLGPLAELLHRKIDEEYDGKTLNKDAKSLHTSDPKNRSRQEAPLSVIRNIPKNELVTVGILGKGSFGSVELVRHKKTGQTYALKSVPKAQIVATGQQEHIISEKNVMMMIDSPFVVKLFNTYKDKKYLYFLLEVVLGGELFTVLRARTVFDEHTARFYGAAVICAFDYMHKKEIIYRDLKPENLLLDNRGYLKITDFGFAKVITDRTYTLCGTPDYLAPEVISGAGHGKGVDWWTLGILIFEMLASYPPFYDEDPMKTYAKIMFGKVKYPKHFRRESVQIIRGFLAAKPSKRLGYVRGGTRLIREQPWFAGFDWDALYAGQMEAPIIPKISDGEDRSNFEVYDDGEQEDEEYIDDGTGWEDQF